LAISLLIQAIKKWHRRGQYQPGSDRIRCHLAATRKEFAFAQLGSVGTALPCNVA
jgi:hypothetical protein